MSCSACINCLISGFHLDVLRQVSPELQGLLHNAWVSNRHQLKSIRLFIPFGDGELNMLESIVKDNFINFEHEIIVLVSLYTDARCLLSDRSFSTNTDRPGVYGFDFNLSSRAFIRYLLADTDAVAPPNTPPEYLKNPKNERKKLPRPIQLHYCVDNMELLGGFNRNVVYQSYRHVYCASKPPFIL